MPGAAPRVPVRLPDGSAGTVPSSEVSDLPEGAEVISADEAAREATAAKHNNAVDKVGAFSTGALRSATFGASDHALIGLGGALDGEEGAANIREQLGENKEANAGYNTAGELTGLVAPALLTGGATGGARLLGGAGAAIGKAGGVAEGLAARAFGKGAQSLGMRMLQRGAMAAAGAGTESALIGASHEVSEAALGDHELVAEHVMGTMAKDFLVGAVAGGALGAGGELLKEGGRRALGVALGKTGNETIAAALQRKSNELYYGAAGPTQKMVQRVEQTVKGGTAGLGGRLRTEVEDVLGRGASSRGDFAEAAPLIKKKGGALIDDALEALDAAAEKHGRKPNAGQIFRQIHDDVLEPLKGSGSGAAGENAVRNWAQRTGKILGIIDDAGEIVAGAEAKPVTFKQLHKIRREVDDLVFTATGQRDTLSAKAMKQVRDTLEGHIETGAETLAGVSGESALARDYAHGKQVYQAGAELEKAATRGVAQAKNNRFLSLTDNIMAGAGAGVGGMVAGPLGAAAGGAIAGLANNVVRRKFDFVASDILQKAAQLGTIARISADAEKQMIGGVRGFLRGTGAMGAAAVGDVLSPRKGESRGAAYMRLHADVQRLQDQPERQARAVSGVMGDAAPHTTAALGTKLSSGLAFLASKLPAPTVDPYHIQQQLEDPTPPTDEDIDTAEKYLRAFMNPNTLLEDMRHGQASPEAVEMVKTVYPRVYEKIVETLDRELASPDRKELDWDQQVQLEILFDRPTDAALDPEMMNDVQGLFAQAAAAQAQAEGGGGGGGSVGRDKRAERQVQTVAQRLEGE